MVHTHERRLADGTMLYLFRDVQSASPRNVAKVRRVELRNTDRIQYVRIGIEDGVLEAMTVGRLDAYAKDAVEQMYLNLLAELLTCGTLQKSDAWVLVVNDANKANVQSGDRVVFDLWKKLTSALQT